MWRTRRLRTGLYEKKGNQQAEGSDLALVSPHVGSSVRERCRQSGASGAEGQQGSQGMRA